VPETVNQVESENADHSQLLRFVVTRIDPVVALAATVICEGLRLTAQVAGWVTVKVDVPTPIVPVRDPPPVFASALNPTAAGPAPDGFDVTESHSGLFDVAVHWQPALVLMLNVPAPPVALTVEPDGVKVYEQLNPLCVILKLAVPTVIAPKRIEAFVFWATVNCTVPLPVPVPAVTVIHGTLAWAVHEQPWAVESVNEPLPPAEPMLVEFGERLVAQLPPAWVI
jgi:hypothetical protein